MEFKANIISKILLLMLTLLVSLPGTSYAIDEIIELRNNCAADLQFIRNVLKDNSAGYKNPNDPNFATWLTDGMSHAEQLVEEIGDQDDCFFAINYYLNGFKEKNIKLKPNFPMPTEQYPGILTAKIQGVHQVVYKLPGLKSLGELKIGDELLAIDDISVDEFFHNNLLPFYSYNNSEASNRLASTLALIDDGNKFVPTPLQATFNTKNGVQAFDLQYTDLTEQAARIAAKHRSPNSTAKTKIDMHSSGAWMRIPSFYPDQEEKVIFQGILSSLKELAKLDYLVFDLRGNLGGSSMQARAILRNLYGDKFLKSLGKNHSYNLHWVHNTRLSSLVMAELKKTHNNKQIKDYKKSLSAGKDFFEESYDIYSDKDNLYTSDYTGRVRAQVIVLTDSFCNGSCWSFVNEMRQIPGVKHFGAATNAGSFYNRTMKLETPSNNFEFTFPISFISHPGISQNKTIQPHKEYDGDFFDDNQLVDWVLSEIDDEL